jgi:hypothetical protein
MIAAQATQMHHSTTFSLKRISALLSITLTPACGSDPDEGTTTGISSTPTTVTQTDSDPSTGPTPTTGSDASSSSGGGGMTDGMTTTTPTTGTDTTTGTTGDDTTGPATATDSEGDTSTGDDTTTGGGLWDTPNLWYSVDDALVYIEIDPMDGSVVQLVHNQLVPDMPLWHGQNGLTMLEDGSLLGSRESAEGTQIFHVADPPITPDTPATAVFLGIVPGEKQGDPPPRVEALYTDCEGKVYLMDTGVDVSTAEGNRLLRFTGDFLKNGKLDFEVITDLQNASVADIDDMSPGIVDGEISDGMGFAMDSSDLWRIDYTTGTGMNLQATDGTWGIHALGGPLFADMLPRLYILSSNAELMAVQLDDYSTTQLIVGPDLMLQSGYNGWSGLAGPLTECMTTIPQ